MDMHIIDTKVYIWSVVVMHARRRYQERENTTGMNIARLDLEQIYSNPDVCECRDGGIDLLAASIARHGLLQPVIVIENKAAGRYMLVCGTRRVRACRLAGVRRIEAVILNCTAQEAVSCYMEDHLTRREPSVLNDARMIAHAGTEAVCSGFALPEWLIRERVRMASFPDEVKWIAEKNSLSFDQMKSLICIADRDGQIEAASIIAQRSLNGRQAMRLAQSFSSGYIRSEKRRFAAIAADEINSAIERLRAKGIPVHVQMHAQDGGVCICLMVKPM